ncbi:MAG: gliding motility lipoprotein GldH [Bacteroidota bacterium]
MLNQACIREKPTELYHKFPGNQWDRFNFLSFEIPIEKSNETYDILLLFSFTPEYPYETLFFNMDLKTPSGEERINEYQLKIKTKDGKFLGEVKGDSCQLSITLKRYLKITKPGILKIELENLIPRMTTQGISGVVISIMHSGK